MSLRLHAALPLLLTAACATSPETPQRTDEQRAVRHVAEAFFDVIASKDVDAGAKLVIPEATFVVVQRRDGQQLLRHTTLAESLEQMRGATWKGFEEFLGEPTVLVDGDVAMVWGRYLFDLNGERSHTGVDVFNLVRSDDGWKIAGGVYSVIR